MRGNRSTAAGLVIAALLAATGASANTAYVPNVLDKTVSAIDTSGNTVIATIPVGLYPVSVAISSDGGTAYIGSYGDGSVSVIDTRTNIVTATIALGISAGNGPVGMALSPDDSRLYATNLANCAVVVADTSNDTVIASIAIGDPGTCWPWGVAASPDGATVYASVELNGPQNQGEIAVIDTATNAVTNTLTTLEGSLVQGLTVSPDGGTVWVAGQGNCNGACQGISILDTATNAVTNLDWGMTGGEPELVAMSPDGAMAYVQTFEGIVDVVDTSSYTNISNGIIGTIPIQDPGGNPVGLAVTPDGKALYYLSSSTGSVVVIDAKSGAITTRIPVGNSPAAWGNFITPDNHSTKCLARTKSRSVVCSKSPSEVRIAQASRYLGSTMIRHWTPSSRLAPTGSTALWDQSDATGVGINSQNYDTAQLKYDDSGADDFVVPAGSVWKIQEVDVAGLYYKNAGGLASSQNVVFYKNKSGLPGAIAAECDNLDATDSGGSFAIAIPKSCSVKLKGGTGGTTYWLSVVANCSAQDGCGQWGWRTRSSQKGAGAAWENPGRGFHTPCRKRGVMQTCIGQFGEGPDFAFALRGLSKVQ